MLVPCYYSLQCRLAGRPPSCTLCSEVGGGAIAARLTMCTGTGKVWAKVSRSAEYRAQLPPAMLHPILSGKAIPRRRPSERPMRWAPRLFLGSDALSLALGTRFCMAAPEFAAWPPNMVATSWPPTQRPPARSQNFSRNFFSYFTRCLYHMYQAHSGRLFANEFTNLENGLHPLPPFPQRPTPTTRKRGVRPQGVLVRGRRQRHWISHGQHRVASLSTPWGPGNA